MAFSVLKNDLSLLSSKSIADNAVLVFDVRMSVGIACLAFTSWQKDHSLIIAGFSDTFQGPSIIINRNWISKLFTSLASTSVQEYFNIPVAFVGDTSPGVRVRMSVGTTRLACSIRFEDRAYLAFVRDTDSIFLIRMSEISTVKTFTGFLQNLSVPIAIVGDARSGKGANLIVREGVGSADSLVSPLGQIFSTIIAVISDAASIRSVRAVWIRVLEWVADLARSVDVEILSCVITGISDAHGTIIVWMGVVSTFDARRSIFREDSSH